MQRRIMFESAGTAVLAFFILHLPLAAQPGGSPESAVSEAKQGEEDGSSAAKGSCLWAFAGCAGASLFPGVGCPLAILGTYLVSPSVMPGPSPSSLAGKSSQYVRGYTHAYKKRASRKNAVWACVGGIVPGLASVALLAVYIYAMTQSGGY